MTTRKLDCTNLPALLTALGMQPEQEFADIKWFLSENVGRDVGMPFTQQYIFDRLMLESYVKLGGVPQFCLHYCEHRECRHNGLIRGNATGG